MPRRPLRRPGALTELPPLRIVSQIAALQAVFYTAALTLTLFTALAAGTSFGLEMVFGWEGVRGDTTQGWLLGFVLVLSGGFFLWVAPLSPLHPLSPFLTAYPLRLSLRRLRLGCETKRRRTSANTPAEAAR